MNANNYFLNTPYTTDINIILHREYNIKNENIDYNLRIEIDQNIIYYILTKLNDDFEYVYKNHIDSTEFINKLELNNSIFSNSNSLLKLIDNIYQKNQISIKINEDNSYNLLMKSNNVFGDDILVESKLYKNYMNSNDKFNYLYKTIKRIQKEKNKTEDKNSEIDNIENKIKELKTNIKKGEDELKNILNQKNIIIKEINEKLIYKENEIKEIIKKK